MYGATIMISGNLGQAPELRTTQGGHQVCSLSVAQNRRRKDAGEWVDVTDWYSVSVWGKQADACAAHLERGQHVTVVGQLEPREYTDRDGKARTSLDVRADRVLFGPRDGGGRPNTDDDSDIPF